MDEWKILDDELTKALMEKLIYALRDTNAIPQYVYNVIEPVIVKALEDKGANHVSNEG